MKHYILRIVERGFCAVHVVVSESDLKDQIALWQARVSGRNGYVEFIEAYDENEAEQLKESLKRGRVPAYLAREMLVCDDNGNIKPKYAEGLHNNLNYKN